MAPGDSDLPIGAVRFGYCPTQPDDKGGPIDLLKRLARMCPGPWQDGGSIAIGDKALLGGKSLPALPAMFTSRWSPLRVLGQGYEGTVYVVRDEVTEARRVLKVLHRPLPEVWSAGLRSYARGVLSGDCDGLAPIDLIRDSGKVVGLVYDYQWSYQPNRRILWSCGQVGQSLVGAYCGMQYHLMSRHNVGLWDVSADNFRLDKRGQFWFVDFGYGVAKLDNPICAERGLFEYGFVMLLLSIYGLNLRTVRPHTTGYTYEDSHRYCTTLAELASRGDWVRLIWDTVRCETGAVFLDPRFYRVVGDQLPRRVARPMVVMVASELITGIARFRLALREHSLRTRL